MFYDDKGIRYSYLYLCRLWTIHEPGWWDSLLVVLNYASKALCIWYKMILLLEKKTKRNPQEQSLAWLLRLLIYLWARGLTSLYFIVFMSVKCVINLHCSCLCDPIVITASFNMLENYFQLYKMGELSDMENLSPSLIYWVTSPLCLVSSCGL